MNADIKPLLARAREASKAWCAITPQPLYRFTLDSHGNEWRHKGERLRFVSPFLSPSPQKKEIKLMREYNTTQTNEKKARIEEARAKLSETVKIFAEVENEITRNETNINNLLNELFWMKKRLEKYEDVLSLSKNLSKNRLV